MTTFVNRLVRGEPVIEPDYWWRLNEDLDNDVAHCVNEPGWDGEWIGDRELTRPRNSQRASKLDKTARIRLPYSYEWFETGNWTISFWIKCEHPIYYATSPSGAGYYYLGGTDYLGGTEVPVFSSETLNSTNGLVLEQCQAGNSSDRPSCPFRSRVKATNSSTDHLTATTEFLRTDLKLYTGGWHFVVMRSRYDVGTNQTKIDWWWNSTQSGRGGKTFGTTSAAPWTMSGLVKPFDTNGYLNLYGHRDASYQDFRIYTKDLTSTEIRDVYEKTSRKWEDILLYQDPIALFPCNESSGTTLEETFDCYRFTGQTSGGGANARTLAVNGSPTMGVNDSPIPNFPDAWGRKCIHLNSSTEDYLWSVNQFPTFSGGVFSPYDTYHNPSYASGHLGYHVGAWVKLDEIGTRIEPIFTLKDAAETDNTYGAIRFNASGDLELWGGDSGASTPNTSISVKQTVLFNDLPDRVKNDEWFFISFARSFWSPGSSTSTHVYINGVKVITWTRTISGFGYPDFQTGSGVQIGKFSNPGNTNKLFMNGKVSHVMFIPEPNPLYDYTPEVGGTAANGLLWTTRWKKIMEQYSRYY